MRELRHDFRATYHVAYDDVPTREAIDLVLTLPPGSMWRRALRPEDGWDDARYMLANAVDLLNLINWRLANCPGEAPPRVERPGDRQKREQASRKVSRVRRILEETVWEEAEVDG